MAMSSAVDGPADETDLTGTGEIRLMPDLSTLRRIPWYYVLTPGISLVFYGIIYFHLALYG